MDTASSRRDNIVKSVMTNQIKHVIKMEGSFDIVHCLAYLEAVTENFSLGNAYNMFCGGLMHVRRIIKACGCHNYDLWLCQYCWLMNSNFVLSL